MEELFSEFRQGDICLDGPKFEEWEQAKFIPGFLFYFPFLFRRASKLLNVPILR